MKEPKWSTCTEKELWEYVALFLSENKISTVLVGGSVVSIYSSGAYSSGDLDIVIESYQVTHKEIEDLLKQINFHKIGTRNYFKHPECDHILIEFMAPPVAIGDDYKIEPKEIEIDHKIIKMLSPTDCIKDRLASYIYFNARECLDQAILVAKAQLFNMNSVKKWCENEGEKGLAAFNELKKAIVNSKNKS